MQRQIKREKSSTPTIYQTIDISEESTYTIQRIEIPESEYEDAVAAGNIQVIETDPDEEDDEHDDNGNECEDDDDEEDEGEIEEIENDDDGDDGEVIEEVVFDNREFTIIPKPAASTSKSKSHYCSNCGNCYGAAGSLKLHIRACLKQKETEERALEARKCHICGRVYNSISYLKEHILRHSGKGPRKCSRCHRKFMDKEKYDKHVKSHGQEDELAEMISVDGNNEDDSGQEGGPDKKTIKEYTCSFCQKKFTVVFDSRSTKRRYACDDCREKFTNEENLKKHKESLEEKKDFRCERCGRKFVFEGFLQRHTPTCDGTIKRKRDRV